VLATNAHYTGVGGTEVKRERRSGAWRLARATAVQLPAARGGTGPVREFCRRQVSELGSIVCWTNNDLQLVPTICTLPWLSIFSHFVRLLTYRFLWRTPSNQDGTRQLTREASSNCPGLVTLQEHKSFKLICSLFPRAFRTVRLSALNVSSCGLLHEAATYHAA
jgi:hypothetical protein